MEKRLREIITFSTVEGVDRVLQSHPKYREMSGKMSVDGFIIDRRRGAGFALYDVFTGASQAIPLSYREALKNLYSPG